MNTTKPQRPVARILSLLAAPFGVAALGLLGATLPACQPEPNNDVQIKTGEGPNDPNVATDDESPKKAKTQQGEGDEAEADPDGIELTPVGGQGGGPPAETPTIAQPKPTTAPPKKPAPTATTKPTTAPPTVKPDAGPEVGAPPWFPPPLPSGWTWPFPPPNATTAPPPAGSTTPPPTNAGDAGPSGGWTLPPIGG